MITESTNKTKLGNKPLLNPRPAAVVGTFLDGKPNFITVSWCGVTCGDPPTVYIAIRNTRYSLRGIRKNKTFSLNMPSVDLVKETDYCGTVSGADYDKTEKCGFILFDGSLTKTPMIEQFPVNMECRVIHEMEMGDHTLFFGEVIESYISKNCTTNDIPDIEKLNLLCFCSLPGDAMGYYSLGEFLGGTKSIKKTTK